jgi:hypothetical protein
MLMMQQPFRLEDLVYVGWLVAMLLVMDLFYEQNLKDLEPWLMRYWGKEEVQAWQRPEKMPKIQL